MRGGRQDLAYHARGQHLALADTFPDSLGDAGVSDDGSTVVGYLGAQVISNGDPPQRAFYWSAASGFVLVNDLMAAYGENAPDYFFADAISGDGSRILVTGNVGTSIHDTNSVIVTLRRP